MEVEDPSRKTSTDLAIVGGGVIGLAIALLAVRRGMRVRVIDPHQPGAASAVAAGLLAPSLGRLEPAAAAVFRDARDRYDDFLELAREASGNESLRIGRGILEIPDGSEAIESRDPDGVRLDGHEILRRYPDLAPPSAGVLHARDGWIDPVELLEALRAALPSAIIEDVVEEVEPQADGIRLLTAGQRWVHCDRVVIAAGWWSPGIKGLSKALPIRPAKGEVLVLETRHSLETAVASGDAYLVPRGNSIVVGSTFELNRDDPAPTAEGQATLTAHANRLIPGALARATARRGWAGLRPITPDKLPIIDRDPRDSRIVYACGHGKNGLLLAGVTAEMVVDLLSENRLDPASPFRLDRFKTS